MQHDYIDPTPTPQKTGTKPKTPEGETCAFVLLFGLWDLRGLWTRSGFASLIAFSMVGCISTFGLGHFEGSLGLPLGGATFVGGNLFYSLLLRCQLADFARETCKPQWVQLGSHRSRRRPVSRVG